jgi:hypothetical protein
MVQAANTWGGQNDGNENFTPHTIATSANGPASVYAVDVDGDGDMDVLSASQDDDKIAWYENLTLLVSLKMIHRLFRLNPFYTIITPIRLILRR